MYLTLRNIVGGRESDLSGSDGVQCRVFSVAVMNIRVLNVNCLHVPDTVCWWWSVLLQLGSYWSNEK